MLSLCCILMVAHHHRLEIEVQTVAKDPSSIKGSHLEAVLYLQDLTDPSEVRLVRESRCKSLISQILDMLIFISYGAQPGNPGANPKLCDVTLPLYFSVMRTMKAFFPDTDDYDLSV